MSFVDKDARKIKVLQGIKKFILNFNQIILIEQLGIPDRGRRDHIPSQDIRSVSFHYVKRINNIAKRLAHLFPVLIKYVTVDNYIPVSRLVK